MTMQQELGPLRYCFNKTGTINDATEPSILLHNGRQNKNSTIFCNNLAKLILFTYKILSQIGSKIVFTEIAPEIFSLTGNAADKIAQFKPSRLLLLPAELK